MTESFGMESAVDASNEGTLSPLNCVLLLFTTGIGTGVLVLPYTMSLVGWQPMMCLFLVGGLMSAATTAMIFESVDHIRKHRSSVLLSVDGRNAIANDAPITYGGALVASTDKPWMMIVLDVILILYSLGSVITYVIFLSQFLCSLPIWSLSQNLTKVLVCTIQCPIMLADSIGVLSKFAPLSVLTLLVLTVVVLSECPHYMKNRVAEVVPVGDLSKLPEGLCICIFAFMWHTNSVGIARELRRPSLAKSIGIALVACLILGLLYSLMALGGYLSFGADVSQNVVTMYPRDKPLFVCLRLALSCSILIACPANLMPMRESVITLVQKGAPTFASRRVVRQALGILQVAIVLVFSILVPKVVALIKVIGGALATFLMLVFPAIIWGRLLYPNRFLMIATVVGAVAVFLIISAVGLI
eukprot:TRINITY_DN33627_c0_g1_i1.p1 TRINITY_DN33627_c0_g1~~TRINITY_DN33627_c0_g1_i1.p1  ORF type:complete len:415 (+),score=33.58 TRINITY_DN33627_c0_g1_i1:102-1346(+)